MNFSKEKIKYDENGLIPAIVQDEITGQVLMLAYMNETALEKTVETGETWFFSRSRQGLWHKGATSGNRQMVRRIAFDCDQDALLVTVQALGPACHTGEVSCFYQVDERAPSDARQIIHQLVAEIKKRKENPEEGSYTAYLFREGIDKILKKIGEETSEVIIGAKNNDKAELISELADLTYHTLVLMELAGIKVNDIKDKLMERNLKGARKLT